VTRIGTIITGLLPLLSLSFSTAVISQDHAEEEHEEVVRLSQDEIRDFGIEIAEAGPGELHTYISLPGEIVVNADRMGHVTPRVSGVVTQVRKNVGDLVVQGEVLAVLESPGMADAKVAYLTAKTDVALAEADVELARSGLQVWESDRKVASSAVEVVASNLELDRSNQKVATASLDIAEESLARQQVVHDNTAQLLKDLHEGASYDGMVAVLEGKPIGESRSRLLGAYSALTAATAAHKREQTLYDKRISSEAEFLEARKELETAQSEFDAVYEGIAFQNRLVLIQQRQAVAQARQAVHAAEQEILDAQQKVKASQQSLKAAVQALQAAAQTVSGSEQKLDVARSAFHVAEQRLHILGLTNDDIAQIQFEHENNPELVRYVMRAPFNGTVIDKHVALGETLTEDSDPYEIADLSTVWINLTVYQKDLPYVDVGQPVLVSIGRDVPDAEGTISWVSPIVREDTRTALARVVLPNTNGRWRPGLFITGQVAVSSVTVPILVPTGAIHRVEDRVSVFVQDEDGFEPHPVTIGRTSETHVEIVSGLLPGQRYVFRGGFTLKAELEKGAFGGGHGH